jgi:hypothetical protein
MITCGDPARRLDPGGLSDPVDTGQAILWDWLFSLDVSKRLTW